MTVLVTLSGAVTLRPEVYSHLLEASILNGAVRPRMKVAGAFHMGVTVVGDVRPLPAIAGSFGSEVAVVGSVQRALVRAVEGALRVSTVVNGAVHPYPRVAGTLQRGVGLSGAVMLKPRGGGTLVHIRVVEPATPEAFLVGALSLGPFAVGQLNLYTGIRGEVRPRPLVSGEFSAALKGAVRPSPHVRGQLSQDWQDETTEYAWAFPRYDSVVVRHDVESIYV